MFTHRRDVSYEGTAGTLSTYRTQSAESEHEISIDIPAAADQQEVAFALDITQLKGFFMSADGPLTVETNVALAPDDTFSLLENEPVHFLAGGTPAEDNPFTVDVTKLFVTNPSSGVAVHLDIRALVDPTV